MDRNEILDDLIALAEHLKAHPELPVDKYTVRFGHSVTCASEDDTAGLAEVERIAAALGVEVEPSGGTHFYARKAFGAVEYEAHYITKQEMADYSAFMNTRFRIPTEERIAELEAQTADEHGPVCDDEECEDCAEMAGA